MPETDETILPALELAFRRHSDEPAFDFMGKKATYRELEVLIGAAAAGLQSMGVGRGTRIGLFMPNTPYYLIMFFAALRTGATVVNFDATATEVEIGRQLKTSGVEILVTLDLKQFYDKAEKQLAQGRLRRLVVCNAGDMLPLARRIALTTLKRRSLAVPDKRNGKIISFRALTRHKKPCRPVSIEPEDVAVLQFTGGTTGVSKGVMLSHSNLAACFRQISECLAGRPGAPQPPSALLHGRERFLSALPFSHVFGTSLLLVTATCMGAEQIIVPDPRDADKLATLVQRKKVTVLPAIPRTLRLLSERLKKGLPDLRVVITGGSALPKNIQEDFEKASGKTGAVIQAYGMTETTSCIASNSLIGRKTRAGSVGLPLAGTKIEIRDPSDPEKVLRPLQSGEVFVQGPQVMKGYLDDAEATASALRNGWLRTGDVGHLDNDGYLYLDGRLKEIIKVKGKSVFPREVEEALLRHEAVAECAVIGVHDRDTDEAVKAFVRFDPAYAKPLPDDESLRRFLSESLSKVKIPKYFEICRAPLPVTRLGKTDKKALSGPAPVRGGKPERSPR